jgi:RNA chaperone Hfq
MNYQRPPFRNRPAQSRPDPELEPEPETTEEQSEDSSKREAEYLRHLTADHTPVTVHLLSGEKFQGYIEYYDRRFIRLTRQGAPNLFIFKKDIKYLSEEC